MDDQNKLFSKITDADVVKAGLQNGMASFRHVNNYFQMWEKLSEQGKSDQTVSLSALLTERAYDAEKHTRILIKYALDALNGLRDTGELASAVQTVSKTLAENPDPQFIQNLLSKAAFELKEVAPELDEQFWTNVTRLIQEPELKFEPDGNGIKASKTSKAEGLTGTFMFPLRSAPGNLGRVSATEFFGVTPAGIWASALPFRTQDSQKDHEQFNESPRTVDLYGESVGALLELRDLMYRHARETEAFGQEALRGGAIPVLVAAIIIFIIAAAALIAGAFLLWLCGMGVGSPTTCIIGGILVVVALAGFICLGVPACVPALASLITITKCV